MKVIIPVAGFGKRLRPHTLTQPKVLLNVAGHPMIYYIVDDLIKKNIAESIIFITGYRSDDIQKYLNKTFKFKFDYVEQKEMLGLGHAVLCAKEKFDPLLNEDVMVILGDSLFDVDLKDIIKSKYSAIGVKKVEDPKRFGVVETNKKGFISRFVEKPASPEVSPSNNAIVGIYLFKNSTLLFNSIEHIIKNNISTKGEYQITDAMEVMIQQNEKFIPYNIDGWLDCGKHETMLETNEYILQKFKKRYNFKNCKINYPVFIGKDVILENCIIGPNTAINKGCLIRNSIIENSILDDYSHVENSIIKDSLIGKHSKIIRKHHVMSLGDYSEV